MILLIIIIAIILILCFLINRKKIENFNIYKRKNEYNSLKFPMTQNDCMNHGFCYGDYSSSLNKGNEEYSFPELSSNKDIQMIGGLHEIRNSNANLSVGDKNYNPVSIPEGAKFIDK